MSTLKFLIEKELKQFRRDAFLPRMVVMFPIIVMLVMPWVTTMDITGISVTVVDNDRSQSSARLISKIGASTYFELQGTVENYARALTEVEYGRTDVVVEIPRDFERDIVNSRTPTVQISANAVNGTKGTMGGSYMSAIIADFGSEMSRASANTEPTRELISVQNRYNPTLNYRMFMIPALMVVLVIMITGFLPALNIVSEKERGTIEQINVSPIGKTEFILAKLIPYWLMGLTVLTLCFVIAWALYGLLPVGSFVALYATALLFIITMSGFGIIISNYSSTLQQAMFVMFFFMMLMMLMSGLFTPVESMPDWAQCISAAIPARYFVEAMRAIYLKGSSMVDIYPTLLALAAFAAALSLWAVISYRKRA